MYMHGMYSVLYPIVVFLYLLGDSIDSFILPPYIDLLPYSEWLGITSPLLY